MTASNVHWLETPPPGVIPFEQAALQLHPDDDVAIAKSNLPAGTQLQRASADLTLRQLVVSGHKVALRSISAGEAVHRYGQIIGFATAAIAPGDHVHGHNLGVQDFARDYAFGSAAQPVAVVPEADLLTFHGYRRASGRVGTRNYIGIIASVNCSAHTVREIAHHFTPERLAAYPNVDGVTALAHHAGCAVQVGGADYRILQRTLAGMANHPNIGAYLIVGLGCESNQISDLIANYRLADGGYRPPTLTIQDEGGIRRTVQAGITAVEELLPLVNQCQRTPQPISELMIALQCGGSDGWSGVTANPVLGMVSDEIVRQGGTLVLAETPEIYGAEHLLTSRAISPAIGQKLVEKVRWWEQHTARLGIEIDNNPSIGNKAGGLTTIYEKSLGAVAKGGTTPLMDVYDYAAPVTARGLTFMDTPGYDPVSVTGQVAGGCNLVVFTTGRGSVFGFKPAPSIKVVTNTATFERMQDDMDVNAGQILDGVPAKVVAQELMNRVLAVASGEPSKSEAQGVGEAEFNPWNLGGML
ncbi:MAG: altronate dehydratase [Chloroflexi bacterium]|nr:altronate dehydratase [Chloroflexota bacterium]